MKAMNNSIVISSHVINTINSLPKEEQITVASAFVSEMIMGENPEGELSPLQTMLYSVIRFYVQQDSAKFNGAYAHSNVAV
ncbi:MAG: hypothetical protein IKJ52_05020 [Muribaculaceae bacterium]|nr:hypothetical protein [Muribaculaceae bacterium]